MVLKPDDGIVCTSDIVVNLCFMCKEKGEPHENLDHSL